MALGGPDTRLRMIAIKQQSGMPLTDKEIKRLAQRQSVEAMYVRNGWGVNGGMQGAYNDASGHFQARSMANSIGRIQGEYGENAVAGVQKYNREDLIDRDRLNKANIEGRLLINQHQRFVNDHQEGVYNQGVAEHEARMKSEEALYGNRLLDNQRKQNDYELANNVRRKRLEYLKKEQEDKKNYDNTPLYLRDPNYKPYSLEQAKADAIASGDEAGYLAVKGILDERRKIALDSQSAQLKAKDIESKIDSRAAKAKNAEQKAADNTPEQKAKSKFAQRQAEIKLYEGAIAKARAEGDEVKARRLESEMQRLYFKTGNTDSSVLDAFGGSSGYTPMNKEGKTASKKNKQNKPWLSQ